MTDNQGETRQERRERRLKKKRERMPKHGKNLAKIYIDAVLKRLRRHRVDKQ
jgi:predicted metalloprotease